MSPLKTSIKDNPQTYISTYSTNSFHPKHFKYSIPPTQTLRLNWIWTEFNNLENHLVIFITIGSLSCRWALTCFRAIYYRENCWENRFTDPLNNPLLRRREFLWCLLYYPTNRTAVDIALLTSWFTVPVVPVGVRKSLSALSELWNSVE